MKTTTILLVDDDEFFVETMRAALELRGQTDVDIACNGQDALLKLEKKEYDIILSDIDMPIMDGFTFYVVATQTYPSTRKRFLFLSGNISDERLAFIVKHDAMHLQKPFSIHELHCSIKKLLQASC